MRDNEKIPLSFIAMLLNKTTCRLQHRFVDDNRKRARFGSMRPLCCACMCECVCVWSCLCWKRQKYLKPYFVVCDKRRQRHTITTNQVWSNWMLVADTAQPNVLFTIWFYGASALCHAYFLHDFLSTCTVSMPLPVYMHCFAVVFPSILSLCTILSVCTVVCIGRFCEYGTIYVWFCILYIVRNDLVSPQTVQISKNWISRLTVWIKCAGNEYDRNAHQQPDMDYFHLKLLNSNDLRFRHRFLTQSGHINCLPNVYKRHRTIVMREHFNGTKTINFQEKRKAEEYIYRCNGFWLWVNVVEKGFFFANEFEEIFFFVSLCCE